MGGRGRGKEGLALLIGSAPQANDGERCAEGRADQGLTGKNATSDSGGGEFELEVRRTERSLDAQPLQSSAEAFQRKNKTAVHLHLDVAVAGLGQGHLGPEARDRFSSRRAASARWKGLHVPIEKIEFDSDGYRLVGDLHLPVLVTAPRGAVVLTGPFSGVKDQVVGY